MFEKSRKGKGLGFNLGISFLFLSLSGFLNVSIAADYPTKPIQIVAAFSAGGGSDITARFLSDKVSALLGQPAVVINKTGGGGVIGTYAVMAASADGYTILVGSRPMISAPFLTKGITFKFPPAYLLTSRWPSLWGSWWNEI